MSEDVITVALRERREAKVIRLLQPGTIPPKPRWMEGESGYVESVHRTCLKCGSNDVWRGPWCNTPEMYLGLKSREAPVKHSGRRRNAACLDCGEFWNDIQAIPYELQDWVDGA